MQDARQSTQFEIEKRTREWWSQLLNDHPAEHFYGCIFAFNDDYTGPSLWANSIQNLQKNFGSDVDDETPWIPSQWAYHLPLDDVWDRILNAADGTGTEQSEQRRVDCLIATIQALKGLAAQGLWKCKGEQALTYLLVWDGFESDWLMEESARRIQPNGYAPFGPLENPIRFDDRIYRRFLRKQLREPHGHVIRLFYDRIGESVDDVL